MKSKIKLICDAMSVLLEPEPHKRPKFDQVIHHDYLEPYTYGEYLMQQFECSKEEAKDIYEHMCALDVTIDEFIYDSH